MRLVVLAVVVAITLYSAVGPRSTRAANPAVGAVHLVEHLLSCDAGAVGEVRSDPSAAGDGQCGSIARALAAPASALAGDHLTVPSHG